MEGGFHEDPPKDYYRLSPGKEVCLKGAYIIKCEEVFRDKNTADIAEIHCSYDPEMKKWRKSYC